MTHDKEALIRKAVLEFNWAEDYTQPGPKLWSLEFA
jgi:hypothetical protein